MQKLKLYARVSYATALDKPVKVIFKEDPTLLDSYNTKWGTNYKALPAAAYRAGTLELNIRAGTHQAFIPVQVFTALFNGTDDYLIVYTISSADDQIIGTNEDHRFYDQRSVIHLSGGRGVFPGLLNLFYSKDLNLFFYIQL